MPRNLRISSKNAFCHNITIGPPSYVINGGSQASGSVGLAAVQAELTSNVEYPSEGNHMRDVDGVGFKDTEATGKLAIDTGSAIICRGMIFAVAGVSGNYLVTSVSNASVIKGFAAASVTTIYFKGVDGSNLASSPGDGVALTFDTVFRLPPYRLERDITIVNNHATDNINVVVGSSEDLHTVEQPSATFANFPVATLAAGAGMTLELSDASDIYVKGASATTITIFGS